MMKPDRPNLPITAYIATPANIPGYRDTADAEEDLCVYVRDNQPLAHMTFEAAEREALIAAPAAEDAEEWAALIAIAYGCHPAELDADAIKPPEHVSYIIEVMLGDDLRIETTDHAAKSAHLAFRAENPEFDALWIPDDDDTPWLADEAEKWPSRLRIITHRSLVGHLRLLRSTRVPARSRPFASPD